MKNKSFKDIQLSPHFRLHEFLNNVRIGFYRLLWMIFFYFFPVLLACL